MICVLCEEPIDLVREAWVPLDVAPTNGEGAPRYAHHCCHLREIVGGIGHQLAHPWCCLISHDPDAGLTYHQSALMVAALVDVIGIEEVTKRMVETDGG